jgi:hypothetical protein
MKKKDYVPRTHSKFKSWKQTIREFVVANAAAWGIATSVVDELEARCDAFDVLYDIIDNPATRTLEQVTEFNVVRIALTAFLRQLVQSSLVNSNLVSYSQKIAMGLNPRTGVRSERPAITTTPVIQLRTIAGALMEFSCEDSDTGRKARPEESDGVELIVSVKMGTSAEKPPLGPDPGPVLPPVEIIETIRLTNSKCRFNYEFSEAMRGKTFSVRGRWFNNSDHKKDGTLGNAVVGIVS